MIQLQIISIPVQFLAFFVNNLIITTFVTDNRKMTYTIA